MFDIDAEEFKQFKKNLDTVEKHAFIDTVRATLTKEAFETQRAYKKNVASEFTIRGSKKSNIVLNSIGYDGAQYKEHDANKLEAHAGQKSEFYGKPTEQLRKQELGETIISKSKHIAKPTSAVRQGGSYKKMVNKEKLLAKTKAQHIEGIAKHPVKGDKNKQFRQAVAVAHTTHRTINYIPDEPTNRGKFGIFALADTGTHIGEDGKRKINGHSASLLYSFKDKTQPLEKHPILEKTSKQVAQKSGEIFKNEAERRIEKEISKGLKKK